MGTALYPREYLGEGCLGESSHWPQALRNTGAAKSKNVTTYGLYIKGKYCYIKPQ